MRILDGYVGKAVVVHTLIVTAVLLALFFFSTFVAEMADVGKGGYDTAKALQFSLMSMPRQLHEIFPLVALLGTLLGLGAMTNSSELTVMRAAGVSVARISFAVLRVGILMVVAVTLIGESVAPQLEMEAKQMRNKAKGRNISIGPSGGIWARDANTFIHIQRMLHNGIASRLTLYRLDESLQLEEIVYADSARFVDDAWQLSAPQFTRFSQDGVAAEHGEDFSWRSSLTPDVVGLVSLAPNNLSVRELYDYIHYMEENRLDTGQYALSLWSRLLMPFNTAGMILLAIPFIFGSTRSVSTGHRVMVGVMLGIGFYLVNGTVNRLGAVYDLSPLLSALAPTILVFTLWGWLMYRRSG